MTISDVRVGYFFALFAVLKLYKIASRPLIYL